MPSLPFATIGDKVITLDLELDDPQWVRYAGGLAQGLKERLHNKYGITQNELFWLQHNAPAGLTDPEAICQYFIDAMTVLEVTKRLAA